MSVAPSIDGNIIAYTTVAFCIPVSGFSRSHDQANTISDSRRTGVDRDAETRDAFSLFSSTRIALSRSAPAGSVSRGRRTISVKRVAPSLRFNGAFARQLEGGELNLGGSCDGAKREKKAGLDGGHQHVFGAPCIARPVEVCRGERCEVQVFL
jgi:hypothetical protein